MNYLAERKIIKEPYILLDGSDFYHNFSGLKLDKEIILNAIKTYFEEKYKQFEKYEDDDDNDITHLVLNYITIFEFSDLKTVVNRYETEQEYNKRITDGYPTEDYDICNPYGLQYDLNKTIEPIEIIKTTSELTIDGLIKKYFEKVEFFDIIKNSKPFIDELFEIVNKYYTSTKGLYFHLQVYSDGIINISKNKNF